MNPLLKGAIAGLLVTIACYLVPGVNVFAPFAGGLAGGWIAKQGLQGGLTVGLLMTVAIVLPGLVLAVVVGAFLDSIASSSTFEWIGAIAGSLVIGLWILLITHTAALGILGAMIGGGADGRKSKRSNSVEPPFAQLRPDLQEKGSP